MDPNRSGFSALHLTAKASTEKAPSSSEAILNTWIGKFCFFNILSDCGNGYLLSLLATYKFSFSQSLCTSSVISTHKPEPPLRFATMLRFDLQPC